MDGGDIDLPLPLDSFRVFVASSPNLKPRFERLRSLQAERFGVVFAVCPDVRSFKFTHHICLPLTQYTILPNGHYGHIDTKLNHTKPC